MSKRFNQVGLAVLILCGSQAVAQPPELDVAQVEIAKVTELLEQLTLTYGRTDRRLLEPLQTLSNQLLELGRYDDAHLALDHAIQITRFSDGLYAQSQTPFLLGKVENYANRGDWLHANEAMDHLAWLLSRGENSIDKQLIDSLLSLTDLHLRGIAEDQLSQQVYHFRKAAAANQIALRAAKGAWGAADRRLPPMMYKLVVQHYMQAQAVEAGGATGSSLRTYSSSTGMTRTRRDTRQGYYYGGLRLLADMRNLYSNQEPPDLQGIALSDIYIADWSVLFSDSEGARRAYERGTQILLEAGIDGAAIDRFFQNPVLLPATVFYPSWIEAQAATFASTNEQPAASNQVATLSFQQWSPNFPTVRAPAEIELTGSQAVNDTEGAIFSFSLSGLEKVSRWHRGRYATFISVAQNLQMLQQSFLAPVDQLELQESVLALRFRPKLIDGVPQTVNATLLYQMATAD